MYTLYDVNIIYLKISCDGITEYIYMIVATANIVRQDRVGCKLRIPRVVDRPAHDLDCDAEFIVP